MYEIDTATVYQIQVITIHAWEWVLAFLLLILILFYAFRQKLLKIEKNPEYKYFIWGIYAKFFASIGFVSVYYYIYNGGDTYGYYESAMSMANLFYKDPIAYFDVLFSKSTPETRAHFDFFTGYPYAYLADDSKTFMVIKLVSPLAIITGNSYLLSNIFIGLISYIGSWKLFQLFIKYYPQLSFELAIGILFFPSVLFWGSGVLKDSFTLLSSCLFAVNYHHLFIEKKYNVTKFIWLILHALIVFTIKPYILMLLLPGFLFWTFYKNYIDIKSMAIKILILPILIAASLGFSLVFFGSIGSAEDKFSVGNALETASITQNDLKKGYYEGKSFDIGDFDGSPTSALQLFPMATFAGLFRPFIIEADSPFMLVSAIENLYLLFIFLKIFMRLSIRKNLKIIFKDPLVTFCFIFSIFFGFMLGLTTSNYGALIRFKIPMIPFFVSGLVIANYLIKKNKAT